MRRSTVLAGRLNQRDRAHLRGRLDGHRHAPSPDPEDELYAWLQHSAPTGDVARLEQINLTKFLRDTGHIDVEPAERMRQLAIHLEPQILSSQPRGWLALDRIYSQAIRLSPDAIWTYQSRVISAKRCAEDLDEDAKAPAFRRIMNSAWEAAFAAQAIDPTNPDVLYAIGSLCYLDPDHTLEEALHNFDAAIEYNPEHSWALLYRAHCLHDLERWNEAAKAYGSVNASQFVSHFSWRYELLLEQRAYCLFRAGDFPAAIVAFDKLIKRWLSNPQLAFGLMGRLTAEVASGPLSPQLESEFAELLQHEQWSWLESTTDGSSSNVPFPEKP